ncbi:hypothetical protein V1525DRAFT_40649 [Lipomyces kononenkoae]|uniref:Uncharacterized protein n=1 Tax=Lipomyces kononenkoae TaxID=34357 RepID=A0ACC3T6F6_LIPKO
MDLPEIAPPLLRASVPAKVPLPMLVPPSNQDLVAARAYHNMLRALHCGELDDDSRPTLEEMRDAARYLAEVEDKIRETRGDPIQEILRVVTELNRVVSELKQNQSQMFDRLEQTIRLQNMGQILPLKQANRDRDGVQLTLNIIPFVDGSIPTQAPHNLPPLFSIEAIVWKDISCRNIALVMTFKELDHLPRSRLVSEKL